MEADIATTDRGEMPSLMEPMRLREAAPQRPELTEIAVELVALSAGFRHSLPNGIQTALADLVRAMNCYYSNLIEGHDTHPIDIERALNNDYSNNAEQRDLQLEARAHIAVQQWIDSGAIKGRAATVAGIEELHRRFTEQLPEQLCQASNPDNNQTSLVIPGQWRQTDVSVGQHIPISPGAIPRFLAHFERSYHGLGTAETLISSAAAHHRLLWVHPFLDGNGRVARLMSHAMLLDALDTGGIWSIARGLARNAERYKQHLANCDLARRNDLDGRGNLSEEALSEFTRFFLETCIDQLKFMQTLVQPEQLQRRIRAWAQQQTQAGSLPAKAINIIEAILYRGELPRGDVPDLIAASDRQGRRVVAALAGLGIVRSDSSRSPLRIAFPAALAAQWMPGLFPEKSD